MDWDQRAAMYPGSTILPLDATRPRAYLFPMPFGSQNPSGSAGPADTGHFSSLAWALLIVLVVYPLSVGPIAKFFGPTPPVFIRTIYAPLAYLDDHSQAVRSFYEWYAKVWGVRL